MRFEAIQGYTLIKKQLTHTAKTGQVPHAQLFIGPEGSPNLPIALAFATYLNCYHKLTEDACGQCTSCLKMQHLSHPDVKFVFPTSATKQITGKDVISTHFLKQWRTFLHTHPYGTISDWRYHLVHAHKSFSIPKEEVRQIRQHVSLKAVEGNYKLILIWLPEYLHLTAANALLKMLEEPPPDTLFFLVSVHPEKLLSTIRSRTQQRSIASFTDADLASMLTQQYTLPQTQLDQVVRLANGNLNKAFKLVEATQGDDFEKLKAWMRFCYAKDLTQLVAQAVTFQELQKEGQKNFLAYSMHMMRAALVMPVAQSNLAKSTKAEQVFTQKLGQTLTYAQIERCTTWLNQAYYYIDRNVNPKILYLDLSLKISYTLQTFR